MFRSLCACVITVYSVLAIGCGYGLAVREQPRSQNIAIPMFSNKTVRPNLETCLTTRLVELFGAFSGGRVVSSDKAELELTGAILSYGESASAFSATDKVSLYQLSMAVEAVLRNRKTGTVLWKGVIRAAQDYPTSSDLALKINAQDAALDELCRKVAEDIERQSGTSF